MRNQTAVRKTGITVVLVALGMLLAARVDAQLGGLMDKAKGAAESGAKGKAEKEVNAQLMPGCDSKIKKLADALVDAKKRLQMAGVKAYKFEVSGHTDSSGKADHNKELSGKRAQVIVKELVNRGIQPGEITAIGMGSDRPLVTPDNTPAKKAKNRRYEIQVRL